MFQWQKIKQIIFDADDTLWENNMYYVQAGSDFFDLISSAGFERAEVEQEFDALEIQVVEQLGYGSKNFVYILEELYKRYSKRNGKKLDEQKFLKIIKRFIEHPIEKPKLFPNVIETLNSLNNNYELFVLTKGEYDEQRGKIVRAGVDEIVTNYFIPPEKNDATYRKLLDDHHWNASETCMVGNSPKSDINPALRNGMYAIHIPYRDTWKLDNEPVEAIEGRFLELQSFKELQKIFI